MSDYEVLCGVIVENMENAGADFATRTVCAMLQEIAKNSGDDVQIQGEVGVVTSLDRLIKVAVEIRDELIGKVS